MFLDRVLGTHLLPVAERVAGRSPSRLKRLGTFVLLACLVGLPALAHASPPDPAWLPGIYHGADYDAQAGVAPDPPVADASRRLAAGPPFVELRSMRVGSAPARADRSLLGSHLRSPPIS